MPVTPDPLNLNLKVTPGKQIGGDHYQSLGVHPDHFATANDWDATAFSILKYLTRWRSKEGLKDLQKAHHFVERRTGFQQVGLTPDPSTQVVAMAAYLRLNKIPAADTRAFMLLEQWVAFRPTAAMAFDLKTEIEIMMADAADGGGFQWPTKS